MFFGASTKSGRVPIGWHERGYLPHLNVEGLTQSVTFRLHDSLPRQVLEQLELELLRLPKKGRDLERRVRIERWLDAGIGSCVLRDSDAAQIVAEALQFFEGLRYELHAWVVMPNHVHTLFTPLAGYQSTTIVHSWKSFSALKINDSLGRKGRLWMPDYFDRYIRDAPHYDRVKWYIDQNPVNAGLVDLATDWEFGSAALEQQPPALMAA